MGRFFLTVMAGAAELERNQIRERTSAAMVHKASLNEYTGGGVPFGCRLAADGVHLEEDAHELRILVLVRELRTRGVSLRRIAEELLREGYVSRRGRPFHPQQLRKMLVR